MYADHDHRGDYADQRHDHPVRLGDLHAERRRRSEAHGGRAAGRDEPAGCG